MVIICDSTKVVTDQAYLPGDTVKSYKNRFCQTTKLSTCSAIRRTRKLTGATKLLGEMMGLIDEHFKSCNSGN